MSLDNKGNKIITFSNTFYVSLKYACIFLIALMQSCNDKNSDHEDDRYQVYSVLVNKHSGLEKTPWYEESNIPRKFLKGDSLAIYLKYRDSIKALMKKKNFYLLINDTAINITDEILELKDSIYNNRLFFKEYFNGDSCFKDLIVGSGNLKSKEKKIIKEKITVKFPYQLSNMSLKNDTNYLLTSVKFSEVFFDKDHSKAMVYLIDQGGIFIFSTKSTISGS